MDILQKKDKSKEIALETSKLNYIDPRITVAWCKKHEVPLEKIFSKTHREKFRWAIDMADENYVFEHTLPRLFIAFPLRRNCRVVMLCTVFFSILRDEVLLMKVSIILSEQVSEDELRKLYGESTREPLGVIHRYLCPDTESMEEKQAPD
uniref:Topo_C_assoc domain-containing protein n=1 Tax=Steinernema glaseri TaxID=37863 RepID=A0A1I8A711_9BILA